MSTQTAIVKSKYAPVVIPINPPKDNVQERAEKRIASRAYELYQQSGANNGSDYQHWLQAESELVTRVSDVSESASWYTVIVPIKGFAATDIAIGVDTRHAIIAAEKQLHSGPQDAAAGDSSQGPRFFCVKWPGEVDPATASAYLQNEAINLTAKRAPQEKW